MSNAPAAAPARMRRVTSRALMIVLCGAAFSACSDSDAGGNDAGLTLPWDVGGSDAAVTKPDSQGPDTSVDAGAADTTSGADAAGADVAVPDAGPLDAGAPDAGAPDAALPDAGQADAGTPDTGVADAGVGADTADTTGGTDAAVTDTLGQDAPAGDAGGTDAGAPDAGTDAGTPDAGAPVWGPFQKLSCGHKVNTNTDGTVNPFINPARNGQFYVSYVAKGGDLMLTWEDPNTCKSVVGPLQVNKTKGSVYYWGAIGVISDLNGNFYAVWESSIKGSEISFAWSKTGKDFSQPAELVSTSTNGQDPVLWTSGPGKLHAAWRGHHATLPQYDPYYAEGGDVFSSKPFGTGVLVHSDAKQDDQVAVVTDASGVVYLGWQSFDGDIFVSKSTDAGKTWSKPIQVNDVTGKANVGKASFMTITPDNRLVLMWSDKRKASSGNENDVFADSSADGVTWGQDVQVNDNDARYQEDPSMAVGQGTGCNGAIYAVWQDFRGKKSYDIYMSRSVDGGKTWEKNEPIANDLQGDEMNPAIAVDNTCVIGVAWRDSSTNSSFDIGTQYVKW